MDHKSLKFDLVPRKALTHAQIDRLYELMASSYDAVPRERFETDLSWKTHVLLLKDAAGAIQGFTTLARNPYGCGTSNYDVLYTGDTIISSAYWGTQELVHGFCFIAGRWLASTPGKKLYWYLLSKGHRTYLYLPLFFRDYFPGEVPKHLLADIAAACSTAVFPQFWREDLGVLKFPESHGQLKPHLAADALRRRSSRHVKFFLSRNPGYVSGDELVCLAELCPANMKRDARRWLERGMLEPICETLK